jgi:hypothetical protein
MELEFKSSRVLKRQGRHPGVEICERRQGVVEAKADEVLTVLQGGGNHVQ